MASSLAPALLLSMPQLLDPNFNRTVVLLCRHSGEGAFGLVVNRPLVTSGRVVVNLEPPVSIDRELEVWIGGPVDPQRSWMLVGREPDVDESGFGTRIADGLYLRRRPSCSGGCSNPNRRRARASSSATRDGARDNWKPSSRRQRG